MEWLGVVLLYLISGFMKKRQQNARRREIESNPEWDTDKHFSEETKNSSNALDQLLNDLFEDNPKTPEIDPVSRKVVQSINTIPSHDDEKEILEKPVLDENNIIKTEEDEETLSKTIFRSKLSEKEEQYFGKKWHKKTNILRNLFGSKESIKKSIIIKEVLDKPIALRK